MIATDPLCSEGVRERLSRVILQTIASWPEEERGVFVRSHYRGLGTKEIAVGLGINNEKVGSILEECDRKLRAALRQFRSREEGLRCNGRR